MSFRDRNQAGNRDWFSSAPFAGIQREMSRWLDDVLRAFPVGSTVPVSTPSLDVRESDDELCVVADMPGVELSCIDLCVDGNMLTVSAERKDDSDRQRENYHVSERRQGYMRRSVRLPFVPDPEQVRARYSNGVLTVRMPKRSQKMPGRRITIEADDAGASTGGTPTENMTSVPREPDNFSS